MKEGKSFEATNTSYMQSRQAPTVDCRLRTPMSEELCNNRKNSRQLWQLMTEYKYTQENRLAIATTGFGRAS
jgi:hypothetical protein